MRESEEARAALLRFYDAFTEATPGALDLFDRQHGHFSVGVPDEVAFANAAIWSHAAPAHSG